MFVLHRLPATLALLMLGALSMRMGLTFLVALPLTLALLVGLFVPRTEVQRVISSVLWIGTIAWVGMVGMRVNERLVLGQPWLRLAAILGAVTLFTAWSAWLMRRPKGEAPASED